MTFCHVLSSNISIELIKKCSYLHKPFLQPTEFQQMDHEKDFKTAFKGISIFISFYTFSIFVLAHMIKPGVGFNFNLNEEFLVTKSLFEGDVTSRLVLIVVLSFFTLTVLVLVTSEVCACTMIHPATTIVQPASCSTNFITNPIPFVSLHICITVGFFREIILRVLFDIALPPWLVICLLLLAILATNSKAQKHVALRIRQKVAMMTVGRNNAVHPIISVALVPLSEQLRDQVDGVNPC